MKSYEYSLKCVYILVTCVCYTQKSKSWKYNKKKTERNNVVVVIVGAAVFIHSFTVFPSLQSMRLYKCMRGSPVSIFEFFIRNIVSAFSYLITYTSYIQTRIWAHLKHIYIYLSRKPLPIKKKQTFGQLDSILSSPHECI